jgi:hypothetical protein
MPDGEQPTGIRDCVYDLSSVLYHAAQGGTVYAGYIADAVRDGDKELADFFREVQQQNAQRAKALLDKR